MNYSTVHHLSTYRVRYENIANKMSRTNIVDFNSIYYLCYEYLVNSYYTITE